MTLQAPDVSSHSDIALIIVTSVIIPYLKIRMLITSVLYACASMATRASSCSRSTGTDKILNTERDRKEQLDRGLSGKPNYSSGVKPQSGTISLTSARDHSFRLITQSVLIIAHRVLCYFTVVAILNKSLNLKVIRGNKSMSKLKWYIITKFYMILLNSRGSISQPHDFAMYLATTITVISKVCKHITTVSDFLLTPKIAKTQKQTGLRKKVIPGWSIVSPPSARLVESAPAPRDEVTMHKTSCTYHRQNTASVIVTKELLSNLPYRGKTTSSADSIKTPLSPLDQNCGSHTQYKNHSRHVSTAFASVVRLGQNIAQLNRLLFLCIPPQCTAFYQKLPTSTTCTPCDTGNEGNDKNENKSQTADSLNGQQKRNNVRSRAAMFNGSRSSSYTAGDDDDGGEDEEKRKISLLSQCETSCIINIDFNDEEEVVIHYNDQPELSPPTGESEDQNTPETSTEVDKISTRVEPMTTSSSNNSLMLVNSTKLNHSYYNGYSIGDLSVFQGVSRIWEAAKNVSLFGAISSNPSREIPTPLIHDEEAELSLTSDLDDTPNISDISLEGPTDRTVVNNEDFMEPEEEIKISDNTGEALKAPHHPVCVTGIASPIITPIPPEKKAAITPIPPSSRYRKMRRKSESSAHLKGSPYSVPPSVVMRKNFRSQARFNRREYRADETPVGRIRTTSETVGVTPGVINCIRARDPGLYDCSGVGDYFHLEHNYMDRVDTGRIDKTKLFATLEKFLTIPEDSPNNHQHSVQLSWDRAEISAISTLQASPACHIDQRSNLIYLLGRMIHHTKKLTSYYPDFNGLSLTILPNKDKFLVESPKDSNYVGPLPILHVGKTLGLNIVPKKHDRLRCNIHDVHLENFTLMTVYQETFSSMELSIPGGWPENEFHVLITPCIVDEEIDELQPSLVKTSSCESENNPAESSSQNDACTEKSPSNSVHVVGAVGEEHTCMETVSRDISANEPQTEDSGTAAAEIASISSNDRSPPANTKPTNQNPEHDMITHGNSSNSTGKETGAPLNSPKSKAVCLDVQEIPPDEPEGNVGDETQAPDKETYDEADASILLSNEPDKGFNRPAIDHKDNHVTQLSKKDLLKNKDAKDRFISSEICVGIVNSYKKDAILTWLMHCELKVSKKKKVQKLRAQLLKHIQRIHEGKARPTIYFVSSFLEKVTYPQLLEEAKRIGIHLPKGTYESEARRIINEHLTMAEPEEKVNLPQLLTTDYEMSPSETDTDGDDLPLVAKQSCNTKKVRSAKTKACFNNGSMDPSQATEKPSSRRNEESLKATTKEQKAKEVVLKQHQENSDPSAILSNEKAIKMLEQSLLDVQDRLSAQELLIESISQRSLPEQQTNALKSLQSKNRTLFDTLNIQQNSIDMLKDSVAESAKESKKRLNKINQLHGTVTNNAKQGQDDIAQLKKDVHDWMEACQVMFTELRQQVAPLADTTSQLQNEVKELKQELKLLKPNLQTRQDRVEAKSNNNNDAILSEIKHLREESNAQYTVLNKHIYSLALNNGRPPLEMCTKTGALPSSHPTNAAADQGEKEQENIKPNEKSEEDPPNRRFTNDRNRNNKSTEHKVRQHDAASNAPPGKGGKEQERTSSQQNSSSTNRTLGKSGEDHPSWRANGNKNRNSESTESTVEQPNSNTCPQAKKTGSKKFTTRKCLIVHDPYFSNFDHNKFSKWFDITTAGFESLKHVTTSKSLPSKIKSINPEVLFLHVGQADLLDKESGEKVLQEFKKLIQKIVTHTPVKLCVSQIIPTGHIPQVDSVIKQVNRQLSEHISSLREDTELKKRIFSCNNDSLSSCIAQSIGKHGMELSLNERGLRKLWLNLKDGLNRALNLNRPKNNRRSPNIYKESSKSYRSHNDYV